MTTVFDGPGQVRHATNEEVFKNIVDVRSVCEQADPIRIAIEEKAGMIRNRIHATYEAHGFGFCLTDEEAMELTTRHLGRRFAEVMEKHQAELQRLAAKVA